MAIAITNLTTGVAANATSAATASITPAANNLILLTVTTRTGITADPNIPTATGNSLTWVQVATILYDNNSSSRRRETLFRAMGALPTSGAITIDESGQTQTDFSWIVDQASGTDTSGTNGSGAVVQSATNAIQEGSGLSSITATLAAFSSVNNATYGAFGFSGNDSPTAGSGFTGLSTSISGTNLGAFSEYELSNNTAVSFSLVTSGTPMGAVGIEIAAAVVVNTFIPRRTLLGVGI